MSTAAQDVPTSPEGGRVPGTRPYPWPFDGDLGAAATTLLLVSDGTVDVDDATRGRLRELAAQLRSRGGRVVATRTVRAGVRSGSGPGVVDPVADPLLPVTEVDEVVGSGGVDAFYASDLELVLATTGTRRLLVAGAPLESCVHSTLRTANDMGLECLLLADGCVAWDPSLRGAALSMVEMSGGIFGAVGSCAGVLSALPAFPSTDSGADTASPEPTDRMEMAR